ncbi:MAG: hypothetical protein OSA43_12360, partial [Pirellulales bacterium]|nr:hypothetical protein [Pirellulales bacterium]
MTIARDPQLIARWVNRQANGIAQTAGINPTLAAVGIEFHNRRPPGIAFAAQITTRTNGQIEFVALQVEFDRSGPVMADRQIG